MDGIFTLPYSEYAVIELIQRKLPKSKGFSVYVPASRQQKGVDFIIHNSVSNKIARVQVKSSRTYFGTSVDGAVKRNGRRDFKYHLWLNNFVDRYGEDNADFYILFGLYPEYDQRKNIKDNFWRPIALCYSEIEMNVLLNNVKTVKEKKSDRFFGFGFDDPKKVFKTRGFGSDEDESSFLLANKVEEIRKFLLKN